MDDIERAIEEVTSRVAAAAENAGRKPGDVQLVAVSKTHPPEAVRAAFNAGQRVFGESRVQESLAKIPFLPESIRWHFIGHLQTNKIRKALPSFELFHGVDNLELARQMDRVAAELGLYPKVLIEVNVAGEASKFGFSPEAATASLDDLLSLPRLQACGLMTIAPVVENPEDARPFFSKLRELRDRLAVQGGVTLPELSMGMSGDYEQAIAEGATIVRVGSAIFGERRRAADS